MAKNQKAAANFMAEMHKKSEELYKVRQLLNTREEEFKKNTEEWYEKEKTIKAELLDSLKTLGLTSIKVSSGDSFCITKRKSVDVLDDQLFTKWAISEHLVIPDKLKIKAKVESLVKGGTELPTFMKLVEFDSISVRKAKEKEEK